MNPIDMLLEQHPVFSHFGAGERAELARRAQRRETSKGEVISLYGDVWPYLLMIERGRVNGVKESSEGRQLIVLSLGAGEVFWGLAFFKEGAGTPVTMIAPEASRLYLWHRNVLVPLLLGNGPALWSLTQLMITRMQQVSEIVEGLAFQPVAARLAGLILKQFGQAGDTSVERSLTLDEMAAMVGSTREMVCRILYRFADESLIEVTRTGFKLTDEAGLAELANQV